MTGQAMLMSPKGQNASRVRLAKIWQGAFIITRQQIFVYLYFLVFLYAFGSLMPILMLVFA